ncbi:BnaA03g12160D [Brassica napus]|uniref:BnaA03g12160D protein n=1 Tax=Brassica napus TaxID=3708 RepID=A0A078IAB7_BRANA|nr:BnaA03g12160D [Brassica napus]
MVGRKRKTKTCDKGSKRSWICQLPDVLISGILARVPTKIAVRTGVLSKTWINHWKNVRGLDLESFEFSDMDTFVSFVRSFFDSHRESTIDKIRLSVHYSDCHSLLTQWTDIAIRRRIQHLDVCYYGTCCDVTMPVSLYTCKTLVHLRLCWVVLANLEVVSLPCLKTMHLECIRDLTEPTVEKLISGSPVLEDLIIIRRTSGERFIQVRSNTLKRIHIDTYTEVEIDAPLLECLRTTVYLEKNFMIINLGCSTTLDIDMVFPDVTCTKLLICDTLTDIPRFRGLVTSSYILKNIFLHSEPGPLLQFRDLSRLHVKFSKSDLEMLPAILESCPKLQSLILTRLVEIHI